MKTEEIKNISGYLVVEKCTPVKGFEPTYGGNKFETLEEAKGLLAAATEELRAEAKTWIQPSRLLDGYSIYAQLYNRGYIVEIGDKFLLTDSNCQESYV